ncbi:heterokaryon incompatibility protein [Apiospora marii]|uniref:heterokaryon incompatibility protein n=1 Tax=Apiospora marii TaxID=335849 RepID=UPI00312F1F26
MKTPVHPFFYYLEFRVTEDATGAAESVVAGEFIMALRLDPIPSCTRAHDLASSSLAQSWSGNVGALELVRHWLFGCLENHPSCEDFSSGSGWWPTRLLEISDHHVRLVMTKTETVRGAYATISHCWGTEPFPTLTSSNLARFTGGILRDELPRSFQEAMETTEALGIRYLWIDCYCIIQDDQADWLSEAPLMSKVYSNSQINIGAADAAGPRHGMFRERPINSIIIRPQPSPARGCQAYRLTRKDGRAQFDGGLFNDPLDRAFESKVLRDSSLMTRAWVLQERALSRRMVTFTREEIYWQCHESAATESYPVGWPKNSIERLIDDPFWSLSPSQSLLRNVIRRGPSRTGSSDDGVGPKVRPVTYQERWFNALSSYNAAKLTYPAKDKILAIDGIGTRLAELSDDNYCRGILAKTMPYALLWENKETPAKHALAKYAETSQYPSWHWASGVSANFDKGTHWNYTILRSGHSCTGPQTYCFTSESGLPVASHRDVDYWPRLYCIGRPQKATLVRITKSHGCQFTLENGTTVRASTKWDRFADDAVKMGRVMFLLPVTHTLMSCATGYLDARNNMGLVLVPGRSCGAFRRVGMFSEAWVTDRGTIHGNGKNVKPRMIVIE